MCCGQSNAYYPVDDATDAIVHGQFIGPTTVPFDCWGQSEPTLTSHTCPDLYINGSQEAVDGCAIKGWIEAYDGFVVIPLAEGAARFTFEFGCSPPMVAAFTYELEFHCCFGADEHCDLDRVQSTGYVSSDGSVVYRASVSMAVFCLVATVLGVVTASIFLVFAKLLERRNKEYVTKLVEVNGEDILSVVEMVVGSEASQKFDSKIIVAVFLLGIIMVSLCVYAVMNSEK